MLLPKLLGTRRFGDGPVTGNYVQIGTHTGGITIETGEGREVGDHKAVVGGNITLEIQRRSVLSKKILN
jgi:hypothetical protein